MTETRTFHDPFLGKDVQVSDKLTDRLRGRYARGPTTPNGEPEFGWRDFPVSPIQIEAAAEIDLLRAERAAADQVALTARHYVAAMEARLNAAVDLLRPLAALGPICDHFDRTQCQSICSWTIKGERHTGPTAADCRAADDFIESIEAAKS
jgi:hypothetical protein